MEYRELRERVYESNMALPQAGLVLLTWGNASEIDRELGCVAIKPSGVSYDRLTPEDIVVLDIETGNSVAGNLRPSSDAATHLHLYRELSSIGGIVHTHSHYAVVFAQAERAIRCFGTTHADHFYGAIPITRRLRDDEIQGAYEEYTGGVIVETLSSRGTDPLHCPGVLVAHHGPFCWGENAAQAAENATVLEEVARMALHTQLVSAAASEAPEKLQDRHFYRKHGADAYYGQRDNPC
jgi:L-ribulose-5-phosphate 4-epimerase